MTTKEIEIARSNMETYLNFANSPSVGEKQQEFYRGAAAAINDLLCRIGQGDAVSDLANRLTAGDG